MEHAGTGGRQHAEPTLSPSESQLGALLVGEGLITAAQLEEALGTQQKLEAYKPVGQILLEAGLLTSRQLAFVLDRFHKRARLGEVLVRAGVLSKEQLWTALRQQGASGLRLGEVLLQSNLVGEDTLRQALCIHLCVPFIDLDGVAVDRGLSRLINRRYAAAHCVVPVAQIGRSITVAFDDPSDTDVVGELEASTGRKVNVVTSTRAAFQRAFARMYEDASPGGGETSGHADARPTAAGPVPPSDGGRPPPVVVDRIMQDWQGFVRSVEVLTRERDELRSRWERLGRQHAELEAAQARLRRERDEQAQALAGLRGEHRELLEEHARTAHAVRELGDLHATMLRERELTADALETVLRRLKS